MKSPFRADHCGSLIRPHQLRKARLDRYYNRITENELIDIEDRCIREAIRMQKEAGFKFVTDGEFRRKFWFSALFKSLTGIARSELGQNVAGFAELSSVDLIANPELEPPFPKVNGKIERDPARRNITEQEVAFLKSNSELPFKVTLPSLGTLARFLEHAFEKGATDQHYKDRDEILNDVFAYVKEETRAAAEAAAYIQIDNPNYAKLMAIETRNEMRSAGKNPDAILQRELDDDNELLRIAKRAGNVTGVHICLGTYVGAPNRVKSTRVNYDPTTLARILESLEADTFTCEFSERSGTMDSLNERPKLGDKVVALGIVNVLDPKVETVDFVSGQIDMASRYLDLKNLAVCNNCGFSGASADAFITAEVQQQKLKSLAQAAEKLWGAS